MRQINILLACLMCEELADKLIRSKMTDKTQELNESQKYFFPNRYILGIQ